MSKGMRLPCLAAGLLWATAHAQKPFDSKRDPQADLQAAEQQAALEHKNVMLDFGGNWCTYCLQLDAALHDDPELLARLTRNYVVVHVDVGGLFSNRKANKLRANYPRFNSYPHVLVLNADGRIVHDQVRGDFLTKDDGKGLSHRVLGEFLDRWAPGAKTATGGS